MSSKIKLKVVADEGAAFFLKWELPYLKREFKIVSEAGPDVVLMSFAPYDLAEFIEIPALRRVAYLVPGYVNPYYNEEQKSSLLKLIDEHYDLVFVNPGPIKIALSSSDKLVTHPFSVDVDNLRAAAKARRSINSLLHVSADAPQKDWKRSEKIMKLTGLPYEVFPSRENKESTKPVSLKDRIAWRYNKYIVGSISPTTAFRRNMGYVSHAKTIRKYAEHDGFVHIAKPKRLIDRLDGKYTAALLEAAATGAITFWHDSYKDGNDFDTIFSMPSDPEEAAADVLKIRGSIDIRRHSKTTMEEIGDRCHPERICRARKIAIEKVV